MHATAPRLVAVAVAFALAVLTGDSASASSDRRITESFDLGSASQVRFDFPVGELRFAGVAGDTVRVDLDLRCKRDSERCLEAMEDIRLDSRAGERSLFIEVDRHPRWRWEHLEIEAVVEVPADRDLSIDMGVGELEVEGMRGDLTIDLGVGEARVEAPASAVRSLRLDCGVGDATARMPDGWVEGRRSFLVGSEVHWSDGPGEARIWVDVGVGEAHVDLRSD